MRSLFCLSFLLWRCMLQVSHTTNKHWQRQRGYTIIYISVSSITVSCCIFATLYTCNCYCPGSCCLCRVGFWLGRRALPFSDLLIIDNSVINNNWVINNSYSLLPFYLTLVLFLCLFLFRFLLHFLFDFPFHFLFDFPFHYLFRSLGMRERFTYDNNM